MVARTAGFVAIKRAEAGQQGFSHFSSSERHEAREVPEFDWRCDKVPRRWEEIEIRVPVVAFSGAKALLLIQAGTASRQTISHSCRVERARTRYDP